MADPETAAILRRYFKTAPGEYGEGDRFLGIRVPQIRSTVRRARRLPLATALKLLRSPLHEERLFALLLMVDRYGRGSEAERETIYRQYLAHTRYINNWDLVDTSAEFIVGPHVRPDDLRILETLARSELLWERRIAMLATFHWTKAGNVGPALHVAALLLRDSHDLIHKAVGWMLREVGKRNRSAEEAFLDEHGGTMPRTMLRYAIEHFPTERRQAYLRRKS